MVRCEQCGGENPDSGRFCKDCGAPMTATCPACGGKVLSGARFCGACGSQLEIEPGRPGPAEPHPADSGSPMLAEGEHKQVTILFCDLVSSTALAERLGAERLLSLVNRFFDLGQAEIQRYGGPVSQFMGDGFMALFGAPIAYEDHARRATLAALGIQRRLDEQRAGRPAVWGRGSSPYRGEHRPGRGRQDRRRATDYTAIGDTANVAARLEQGAEPGMIVISEATAGWWQATCGSSRRLVQVTGAESPSPPTS